MRSLPGHPTASGVRRARHQQQPVDAFDLAGDFGVTHLEAGDDFETGTTSDLSLSGMAAGASGGVQMFVSPKLALDGGLSIGVGKMGNIKLDGLSQPTQNLENTTTTRIRFGANWYP